MGDYYFDSTGGCELCDAMEGWYDEEPARPHPHCDCTIGEPPLDDEAVNFDWSYDVGDAVHGEVEPITGFSDYSIPVTVSVYCYSGRTIIETVDVEFGGQEGPADGFEFFDYFDDKIYEEASDLAEELGQDCPSAPTPQGHDVDDDFAFA